mmetsp:Transcript_15143/g.21593  ORF Transcript_15143/g.21593 Transcript_15143/m.21593 type:complete len:90 (+) Transcript_15143:951-1220(+)
MVHLIAFLVKKKKKRFGLVKEAYLYDEALETKIRMMREKEIVSKVRKGKTLDESDLQFHRTLTELSFARSQPEEDRLDWKTPRFINLFI